MVAKAAGKVPAALDNPGGAGTAETSGGALP